MSHHSLGSTAHNRCRARRPGDGHFFDPITFREAVVGPMKGMAVGAEDPEEDVDEV